MFAAVEPAPMVCQWKQKRLRRRQLHLGREPKMYDVPLSIADRP